MAPVRFTMNRNANIRIAINNDAYQGKGYGTEALRLMLDYGFGILNLHRIELNVFSYNERAVHVEIPLTEVFYFAE